MRAPGAGARAPAAATTSARHLRARRSSASPTGCWRRATHPSLRGRSSDIPARTPTLRAPARRWPRLETDPERARHLHLVASRSGACRRPRSPLTPRRPERRDRRVAAVPGPPPACERPPEARGPGHSLPASSPRPSTSRLCSGPSWPQACGRRRRAPRAMRSVGGSGRRGVSPIRFPPGASLSRLFFLLRGQRLI